MSDMLTATTIEGLLDFLRSRLAPGRVIGIDGFMGAGKTEAAKAVAKRLGIRMISVDDFAEPDNDFPYIEKIRRLELQEALEAARQSSAVVLEGICLLSVLDAIEVSAETLVYVKRISDAGIWHDGFHLQDYEEGGPVTAGEAGLHRDEMEYHRIQRPHEKATVTYERPEEHE